MADVDALAREPDLVRVVAWGESVLGALRVVFEEHPSTILHDATGRALVVTGPMEDTDFFSVRIASGCDDLPFASHLELARALHAALGIEVRCDPPVPGTSPSEWWSVSGNGERMVEWWTPSDLVDRDRFEGSFTGCGMTLRPDLFDDLVARYAEPHRAYHTVLHLCEAYSALMDCGTRVERWNEIEIALWFHDAIYDTRRHDNEERSADWSRDELLAAGAAPDVAARVHGLVLATKHREAPEGNDVRLLVDADLSILAAPPDRFAAYERQIRQEYAWVSDGEFREHRGRFLRAVLARPSVFHDPAMRELHETHARRNLADSLCRLEGGAG